MELPVLPNEPNTQFLLKGDEEEEDAEEEEGLASVVYDMSRELFFRFFPRVMLPPLLLLLVEEAVLVVEWARLAEGDSLGLKDLPPPLPLVRGCLRGRPEARDGWCGEGIWGDEDTCRDCVP